MSINLFDYLLLPVFTYAVAAGLDLMSGDLFGMDLSQTLGLTGLNISFFTVLALATLGYVAWTNDWSGKLTWVQTWIIVATVGLIIAPPYVDVLAQTLAADGAALVAMAIQIGGYLSFSYVG